MADATLISAIRQAASQTGANPVLMLATVLTEEGGSVSWFPPVGDNGTSFGPFQFHIGGALGSNPPAWASTYAAILNRAKAFVGAATGADAARIQGPTDQQSYATKVNSFMPEARQLLAQTPANTPTTPTVTDSGGGNVTPSAAVATIVQTQAGVPYSWDGGSLAGPTLGSGRGAGTVGFDCSGLVLWAFGQIGISLPHNAAAQFQLGVPVPKASLEPGDVVFFEPDAGGQPQHEGIYIGSGKVEAAPQTGEKVSTFNLADRSDYVGARRYAADAATNRGGTVLAASAGRLIPADSTLLSTNWAKALKTLLPQSSSLGSLVPSVPSLPNIQGDVNSAVSSALGPIGDAITGAVSDVESKVGHAALWLVLVGGAVGLIYLGAKRAIAPDSTPVKNAISAVGKVGEAAAA